MKIKDSSMAFTPISITKLGFSVYYLRNMYYKTPYKLTKDISTLFYAINMVEFDDFVKRK